MSIALARRLLRRGALTSRDVERALLQAVLQDLSLAGVVAQLDGGQEAVEREIDERTRATHPGWEPEPGLVAALPPGMCERLLAVPLSKRGTETVVAAVFPEPHLAAEFSFHLGGEVVLLRSSYGELRGALEALDASGSTHVHPAVRDLPDGRGSAVTAQRKMTGREGSASAGVSPIELADDPETLLDALAQELVAICGSAVVFASRGDRFEVRRTAGSVAAATRVAVPQSEDSVLTRAVVAGYYLGPLPDDAIHRLLAPLLGIEAGREVYAVPVMVVERLALVVVGSQFSSVLDSTRRMDALARVAGEALTRIVQRKKQGEP